MATMNTEHKIATDSLQSASVHAMGVLASGRALLVFLITLALLTQVALFAAANWADVLHKRTPPAGATTDVEPATAPDDPAAPDALPAAPAGNFLQTLWPAEKWQRIMEIALPVAGFAGVASILVLIVVTIVGIQVNLVGRLPATSAAVSSFYWALIAAVLMFPWGRLLGGIFAERFPWVFSTADDISAAVLAISDPASPQGLIWLRFLAWPAAALLATLICGARFGHAFWEAVGLAEADTKPRTDHARD